MASKTSKGASVGRKPDHGVSESTTLGSTFDQTGSDIIAGELIVQLDDGTTGAITESIPRGPSRSVLGKSPSRFGIDALDAAEPQARDAVAGEDFAAAMRALASLRGPIDAFFDAVTVNDEDPAKRAARLALLARLRSAVHQVADFSKIEG